MTDTIVERLGFLISESKEATGLASRSKRGPIAIALIYAVAGTLWIVVTDPILELFLAGHEAYVYAQVAKGILYVLGTAFLVYWLARREFRQVHARLASDRFELVERMLDGALESVGEAVILVRADNRTILDCNTAAESMFGYRQSDLIGRSTLFLHVDRERYDEFGRTSNEVLHRGETFRCEYQMRCSDGTIIDTLNTVRVIHGAGRNVAAVVSVIQDITERKRAERRKENDLREKQIMLNEIHHRVNNNLSVVIGLLNLQSSGIESVEQARSAFSDTANRIHSIALVHDRLYRSGSFTEVHMREYIDFMVRHLRGTGTIRAETELRLESEDVVLEMNQAIPCGLLLNELVGGMAQCAGTGKAPVSISVRIAANSANECELTVRGVCSRERARGSVARCSGREVVQALVSQIDGVLTTGDDSECVTTVLFPLRSPGVRG